MVLLFLASLLKSDLCVHVLFLSGEKAENKGQTKRFSFFNVGKGAQPGLIHSGFWIAGRNLIISGMIYLNIFFGVPKLLDKYFLQITISYDNEEHLSET